MACMLSRVIWSMRRTFSHTLSYWFYGKYTGYKFHPIELFMCQAVLEWKYLCRDKEILTEYDKILGFLIVKCYIKIWYAYIYLSFLWFGIIVIWQTMAISFSISCCDPNSRQNISFPNLQSGFKKNSFPKNSTPSLRVLARFWGITSKSLTWCGPDF